MGVSATSPWNYSQRTVCGAAVSILTVEYFAWLLVFNPRLEVDHSISSHETHTSTGSDSNIALASKWLNDCSAKHSIYHSFEGGQGPWYPTRLLDVGKHVEESDVRLVISDTDSPTGPYLTLSHCWGSALVSKLEMRDLEKSKAGISASALPKTFRDAVYVTKKLGVQYLWIDALCIIQDSVEDWRQETATMGKVYKNALCNIAATGASDSSIGCFWDRNPLLAQPCKIEFQWDLPLKGSFYCVDASLWPKNIGEAPLNRRAWVTQERMLSPRILHFGMQQMFWECRAMEACEAFPGGLPKALDPLTFIVRTGLKRMQTFVRENENNLSEELEDLGTDGYEYWDGILDVYTRSSLTRPEDKLIALSGLVKEMSLLLKDNNLAGLWKNRFASELLWSVFKPNIANNGTPSFRPEIYRAPTWSWASIDGQVVTGNRDPNNWRLLPTLLEGHIVPAGADPTGQVSNGHIQAQGLLRPVTWDCLWSGRIYKLLLDGITPDHSTFSPDEILGLPSGEVYCFPILDRYVETTRIVDGLVLVRSTNVHSNNEFKRIGTFRYQDEEECWLLMKRQRPGSTQWPLYDDIEEYSFTII